MILDFSLQFEMEEDISKLSLFKSKMEKEIYGWCGAIAKILGLLPPIAIADGWNGVSTIGLVIVSRLL